MKKVVLASLLAVAGAGPLAHIGFAQAAAPAAQAGGQVQMSAEEYAAYNNATTQTTPVAKAAAFEAYLKAYPQSAVKTDVLQQLVYNYNAAGDPVKTLDASDRLLQVDPTNFRAYVFEVNLRGTAAGALTDPTAKQAGLDSAADFARKGLASAKPKDMSDDDFAKLKAAGYPIFYSAIGSAALAKKDNAAAIEAFKSELTTVPVAQTTQPGPQLQDTYFLTLAYYTSTPPDYLNCAYYASRALAYTPEPYKTQWSLAQIQKYCYHKYHGQNDEGLDALAAVAKDNLIPPADLKVAPAPKPADIVANLIATTPDLATLAISDKEYVLQNGKQEDADKVFATIKGKSVELPDVTVVSATTDTVTVSVSEDAVAAKTADFSFKLKAPITKTPAAGDKVTLSGTYDSYTQSPLLITMIDGEVVPKKAPAVKKPATAARRPAARR